MLGMPAIAWSNAGRAPKARRIRSSPSPRRLRGAITALDIRQGMTVMPGASLATINGLSPVWLIASLPQAEAGLARPGARVSATLPAYPGETFSGRVETVLPAADVATRSIEVRIALANDDGRLRPGMTAEARLEERSASALVIPAEAVIRTGVRSIVIAVGDDGSYAPVEVTLGRQRGDAIEIISGLAEGERVVASGQFLIDSEANLTGVLARLRGGSRRGGVRRRTRIDRQNHSHRRSTASPSLTRPSRALNWPSMTMAFGWGDRTTRLQGGR
jgi:Cu(I)/Ag(I) efflux system membrane fusion protein